MKLLFAMALWLWAIGPARAVTTLEQSYTCPIDGQSWMQRIETSSRPTGLRLDLKKLGDVVDPPTLPQCPKCRCVIFNESLAEPVIKKLKAFVLGGDYQMLAAKSPSWACLAHVQEVLDAPLMNIGFSYLRASWQVEEKPALCERYLARAYERFSKYSGTMDAGEKDRLNVLLLCGELERRLGKFEEAEKRFRALLASEEFKEERRREPIVAMQLKLIEARDTGPHALGGTDKAPARLTLDSPPTAPIEREETPAGKKSRPGVLSLDEPFSVEAADHKLFPPR